jgi:uncharacterized protein YdeI (YjbR/CyaY-like superfamily)
MNRRFQVAVGKIFAVRLSCAMTTEIYNGIPTFCPDSPAAWRAWLHDNHAVAEKIWLIFYSKHAGRPSLTHSEAVDEALCYGWIDSKSTKRDADSRYQYFCRRKPNGTWSKVNKEKVARLAAAGRIAPAGQRLIDLAKANGMWTYLDEVEATIVPADLAAALAAIPEAEGHFGAFPRSVKKLILQWILSAKRPETRAHRIGETARLAGEGKRVVG